MFENTRPVVLKILKILKVGDSLRNFQSMLLIDVSRSRRKILKNTPKFDRSINRHWRTVFWKSKNLGSMTAWNFACECENSFRKPYESTYLVLQIEPVDFPKNSTIEHKRAKKQSKKFSTDFSCWELRKIAKCAKLSKNSYFFKESKFTKNWTWEISWNSVHWRT